MAAITKRFDQFTETELDDEIVVMKLDSGEFFSLTDSGAAIWRLIDGARDRDALVAALTREFAADASEIAADVDAFLDMLRCEDLLTAG